MERLKAVDCNIEPHGVCFVARQLVADRYRKSHEDPTIETQVENLVEDSQASKSKM